MTFTAAQLAMQVAILSTAVAHTDTYRDAYEQSTSRQQPLLVLVGDASSAECQQMKLGQMEALKKDGSLSEIAYAAVDRDLHPKLASLIMQGEKLPQLVMYTRVGQQWRRSQMDGPQSSDQVRQFIQQEVANARQMESASVQQMEWRRSSFSS
jgi:thioredoxin-like negative regulator of GroEL